MAVGVRISLRSIPACSMIVASRPAASRLRLGAPRGMGCLIAHHYWPELLDEVPASAGTDGLNGAVGVAEGSPTRQVSEIARFGTTQVREGGLVETWNRG